MIKFFSFFLILLSFFFSCSPKQSGDNTKGKTNTSITHTAKKLMKLSAPKGVEAVPEFITLFEKAYRKIGYEIEIIKLPAKRSLMESQENDIIDGEILRAREVETLLPNLIRIKVPVLEVSAVCYVKDKNIKINKIDDLTNYKVGVIDGHYLVMKKLEHMDVIPVTTAPQALQMLNEDRLNVVVMLDLIGNKCIKELQMDSILISGPPLITTKLYHFINKKHKNLVPQLTKALAELTGNEPEE